jgi:hypothetical protein
MAVEELIFRERGATINLCFDDTCESFVLENHHKRHKQIAFIFCGFKQIVIVFHLSDGSELFFMFFLHSVFIIEVQFYVDIFYVVISKICVDLVLREDLIGVGDVDLIDDSTHYFLGILPEIEYEFSRLLVGDNIFYPILTAAENIVFDFLLLVQRQIASIFYQ